jgi:hypothetical protein
MNNIVRSDTFQTCLFDGLFDNDAIGFVEIVGLLLLEIGLEAESHNDEAFSLRRGLVHSRHPLWDCTNSLNHRFDLVSAGERVCDTFAWKTTVFFWYAGRATPATG